MKQWNKVKPTYWLLYISLDSYLMDISWMHLCRHYTTHVHHFPYRLSRCLPLSNIFFYRDLILILRLFSLCAINLLLIIYQCIPWHLYLSSPSTVYPPSSFHFAVLLSLRHSPPPMYNPRPLRPLPPPPRPPFPPSPLPPSPLPPLPPFPRSQFLHVLYLWNVAIVCGSYCCIIPPILYCVAP